VETDKFIHIGLMSEGKKPSGRPRRRWEDNIETDLKHNISMWTGLILFRIRFSAGSRNQLN
jgi:hypothetical protein